jgi:hypothetical protein
MSEEELKKLAFKLLECYQIAWCENAALHTILENYPMPDGTRGIPGWQDLLKDWTSDPEGATRVSERFSQLLRQVLSGHQDWETLLLLEKLPQSGKLQ